MAQQTLAARLDGEPALPVTSQHARHSPILEARHQALWDDLSNHHRTSQLENECLLGRRWLTVIPTTRELVLTDAQVWAGLHARALAAPLPGARCTRCTVQPRYGHLDTCKRFNLSWLSAHDAIKYAVKRGLEAVTDASIEVEPHMHAHPRRRNDVRLLARAECPLPSTEHDISTTSVSVLFGGRQPAVLGASRDDKPADVLRAIEAVLQVRAKEKNDRNRDENSLFVPVVFSAGGLVLDDTRKRALDPWRTHMPKSEYQYMIDRISCALLRRRVPPSLHQRRAARRLAMVETGR